MEETSKRNSGGESETPAVVVGTKKPRTLAISDAAGDIGEDTVAWLSMEDDTVGELMEFVEADSEAAATAARVRFTDNPYSSLLVFQCYSSYVTINGNEESCGSSFSDSASSVMASVDVGTGVASNIVGGFHGETAGGAWLSKEDVAACRLLVAEEEEAGDEFVSEGWSMDVDGGDHGVVGWEWDEDCVVRFLGEDFFDR